MLPPLVSECSPTNRRSCLAFTPKAVKLHRQRGDERIPIMSLVPPIPTLGSKCTPYDQRDHVRPSEMPGRMKVRGEGDKV